MSKRRAIVRQATETIYLKAESFSGAIGIIEIIDQVGDDDSPVWLRMAAAKAFCDEVFGSEARAIVYEHFNGSILEAFHSIWEKPAKHVVERLSAARWANSMEGVSDLRRFWGLRATECTTDELSAFSKTLPIDSSSRLSYSEYMVPVDVLIEAQQADLARLQLRQAAGKRGRLPENESMTAMLKKEALGVDRELFQELIAKERANQAALKTQREANRR